MSKRVMVICVGSFAAINCELRQARKGATVAVDSGAKLDWHRLPPIHEPG